MSGVCGAESVIIHTSNGNLPFFTLQSHPKEKKVALATRDHYKIFSTTTVPDRNGIDTAAAEKQAPLGLSLERYIVPCATATATVYTS